MKFKYLGIELSGYGDIETEVRLQTTKAMRVAGCLNDTIWKNKYIGVEVKSRIYKAVVRPTKQKPDQIQQKQKDSWKQSSASSLERRDNIREICKVDSINEWVLSRRREWNEHISQMDEGRIVRSGRDKSALGRRSTGRPRKRWCDNLTID
ncbi:uncharacterized protein LOC115875314 [Sitophilus oryzae]|uniref:Uncharacterized protein LOC115875314 n=1 Tax=Sitophilus oryzae TaxID=7048 RepID=A0A6J2X6F5_SITOR|nr:uncharacterized protein LOC115875314 [Sitophilus oryzae]